MTTFRAGPVALIALIALGSAGCTAAISTIRLVSADKALQEAESSGAGEADPYHYVLSQRYMDKALEETADGEYKVAIELADAAKTHAEDAILALKGGTRDVELLEGAGSDLSDTRETVPADPVDDSPLFEDELFEDEEPPPPPEKSQDEFDGEDFIDDEDDEDTEFEGGK